MIPDRHRRALLAALLASAGGACATPAGTEPHQLSTSEYRLGAGDRLRVTVYGEGSLTGVLGEEAAPGAKGFSYRADQRRVYIKHVGADERRYRLSTTTAVLPGDTIRIGERRF